MWEKRVPNCPLLNLPKTFTVNNFKIKLNMGCDCKTENVIYVLTCKLCKNYSGFYFGQTVLTLKTRVYNHQRCFSTLNDIYKKSALSYHIFEKHQENFENGLKNYDLGIVKCTAATSLDRAEDFYVRGSNADTVSINRYKVLR